MRVVLAIVCHHLDDGVPRARQPGGPRSVGGRRRAKLDPHRVFLLRRVAEKDDMTMPELAGALEAECGARAARGLLRDDECGDAMRNVAEVTKADAVIAALKAR